MKELYIGNAIRLPINSQLAELMDHGRIEDMQGNADLQEMAELISTYNPDNL